MINKLKCRTPRWFGHTLSVASLSWETKGTETYGYAMTGLWSSPDDRIKYLEYTNKPTYAVRMCITTQDKHIA